MYDFASVIQVASGLAVLALAVAFFMPIIRGQQVVVRDRDRQKKLGRVGPFVHTEEPVVPSREAARSNLAFLGLPSVHAGRQILNVPALNPGRGEGWIRNRTVITMSRITALLRQGSVPADFVELDGAYALVGTNGKGFILQRHLLTTAEEGYLERQRRDAVERGDGIIEDFQGVQWRIGTACGEFRGGRQSTIQVLSTHPDIGKLQSGVTTCLPPNLLDGTEQTYYDMRARELGAGAGQERVLFFFYAGGTWSCFMGRELTASEVQALQAL